LFKFCGSGFVGTLDDGALLCAVKLLHKKSCCKKVML
jgi:hypothetical protein